MVFVMYFVMFFSQMVQSTTIQEKIKFLMPCVKDETADMVSKCLNEWMPKSQITDENLVLSLIQKESAFQHSSVAGQDGEWGMLQVIPSDAHIQRAALKYRCSASEQLHKASYTSEMGNTHTMSLCRCEVDSTTKCDLPNIGDFVENKYMVRTNKLRHFLKHSPCGALAVGLYELAFWKSKYELKLKQRYWTTFPKYLFHTDEIELYEKWWKQTREDLGENLWIVHHNYGSQIKKSHIARWYPRQVFKYYTQLNKL
jgi:hypothetical protein